MASEVIRVNRVRDVVDIITLSMDSHENILDYEMNDDTMHVTRGIIAGLKTALWILEQKIPDAFPDGD